MLQQLFKMRTAPDVCLLFERIKNRSYIDKVWYVIGVKDKYSYNLCTITLVESTAREAIRKYGICLSFDLPHGQIGSTVYIKIHQLYVMHKFSSAVVVVLYVVGPIPRNFIRRLDGIRSSACQLILLWTREARFVGSRRVVSACIYFRTRSLACPSASRVASSRSNCPLMLFFC